MLEKYKKDGRKPAMEKEDLIALLMGKAKEEPEEETEELPEEEQAEPEKRHYPNDPDTEESKEFVENGREAEESEEDAEDEDDLKGAVKRELDRRVKKTGREKKR